jgi:hypothetical protein
MPAGINHTMRYIEITDLSGLCAEALKPVISDKVSESGFKVGGYHFPTGPLS